MDRSKSSSVLPSYWLENPPRSRSRAGQAAPLAGGSCLNGGLVDGSTTRTCRVKAKCGSLFGGGRTHRPQNSIFSAYSTQDNRRSNGHFVVMTQGKENSSDEQSLLSAGGMEIGRRLNTVEDELVTFEFGCATKERNTASKISKMRSERDLRAFSEL